MRATWLILFLTVLSVQSLKSQITTVDITPEDAVEALLGDNVSFSNVTYIGDPLQMGFMDGGDGTIFSVDAGVVLCTDGARDITEAPATLTSDVDGDADLLTIANSVPPLIGESFSVSGANDLCILEFDFVPAGDEINFNYVFGSDEYEVWVNSSFNDVFAFFLSGPDITGPYAAPAAFPNGSVNIAFVPDSDPELPITISSVNSSINSEYYIDNQDNTDIQVNGFTTSFTAGYSVVCGETYHIKLAIADGSDGSLKSIVVLEENSFTSSPAGISAESIFPLGLVEISSECDSGYAFIGRPCGADTAYYQLTYLVNDSTAEYGVDYEPLPTLVMMEIGQTELFFPIQTIPDGIVEDTEYICIELAESSEEGGPFTVTDTACVAIVDNYTFPVMSNNYRQYCPDVTPNLTAVPQFPGVGPFQYEWTLGGLPVSTENPFFPPTPNQWDTVFYELNVVDFCGAVNDSISPYVANLVPDDPTVDIQTTGEYCPGIDYPLNANRSGGTATHTYVWTDNLNPSQTYDNSEVIQVDPLALYGPIEGLTYKVVYFDNCTPARTDSAEYTLVFPDPLSTEIFMNSAICTDQILDIVTTNSGGYPPYTYTWTSSPQLGPDFLQNPNVNGFAQGPDATFGASGFNVLSGDRPGTDHFIAFQLDDWCSIQSSFFLPALDNDTVTALDCIYPNVVSPNGDGSNDSFIVNELINRAGTMFIYNRWGNLLAETNDNEWKISDDEPEGTYFYVVQFEDQEKDKERKGHFTIVR